MPPLDLRTIAFSNAYIFAICTGVLALLKSQTGGRARGLEWLLADFGLQTSALLLIFMRGVVPDFLSMVVSNVLVVTGAFFGYLGFSRSVSREPAIWPNVAAIAAFAAIHSYFTFADPSLLARNLNGAAALAIMSVQSVVALAKGASKNRFAIFAAFVNAGYAAVALARVAYYLAARPGGADYFASGAIEVASQIAYQALFLLLTCAIALMTIRELSMQLRAEREKFARAFRSSPQAILLTRFADGKVVDVNEAFLKTFGVRREDAIGSTTVGLHIWKDDGERRAFLEEFGREGRVYNRESEFRTTAGEGVTGLLSVEIVEMPDGPHLLSSFADISDRKRMEREIRELLSSKELLLKETHHRIKNNLAATIALLELQAERVGQGSEAALAIGTAAGRLRGMAVLYERLFKLERYGPMPLREYLGPLAREAHQAQPASERVALRVDLGERPIALELLPPLGIIANEIITNALKYGFPDEAGGELAVSSLDSGDFVQLTIENDGLPLPEDFARRGGFGLTLIRTLAEQMEAAIDFERGPPVRVTLRFRSTR